MLKKFAFSSVIALVFATLFGGLAFATDRDHVQNDTATVRWVGLRGEVMTLGVDSFQIRTLRGDDMIILVDDQTRYRGKITNFEDVQIGMKAGVVARRQGDDSWLAKLVFVPENRPRIQRFGGRVLDVDEDGGTFTLRTRRDGKVTFVVDENTRFRGKVTTLADMEEGFVALVGARESEQGVLTAVLVVIPKRVSPVRRIGEVASVDVDNYQLSLKTNRGDFVMFTVDENTHYRSRSGQIDGLEDIEVGMRALVAGKMTDEGNDEFLAVAILVDG